METTFPPQGEMQGLETTSVQSSATQRPPEIEEVVARYIWLYVPPILWLVGSVGNILSIMVFSRKGLKESLTAFFFRILAVCDLLALQENVTLILQRYWGYESTALTDWSCRIGLYCIKLVKNYAVWVLVAVALERFVGILFPHRAKVLFTRRRAKLGLLVILVILMALFSPMLIMYTSVGVWRPAENRIDLLCIRTGNPDTAYYAKYVYPWIDVFMYSLIPFCIMLTSNISIILTLIRASRQRSESAVTGEGPNTAGMTTMLVTVCVAFIVLTIPWCTYFLLWLSINILANIRIYAQTRLLYCFAFMMSHLNHAMNFFLYCISGRRFRKEIRDMFCGVKTSGSLSGVTESTITSQKQ